MKKREAQLEQLSLQFCLDKKIFEIDKRRFNGGEKTDC